MGLCAWRDKNAYFSSSEKETRVKMLQKYLDRNNVPRLTEGKDSSLNSSFVETEGAIQATETGQREDTPGEISTEQMEKPPLGGICGSPPPAVLRPSLDTPDSLPAEWDSAQVSPPQIGQESVDSGRSGIVQEAAAFVFLRYP